MSVQLVNLLFHLRLSVLWSYTHMVHFIFSMSVFRKLIPGVLPAGANPCEHFGKCVNTEGSFQCQCGRGYAGPRCEIDINECLSMPCLNDATCLDRIGEFTCICMPGILTC